MEGVEGQDTIEGDGVEGQGVAVAAGQVGVLLAGGACRGDVLEDDEGGGGACAAREGAEEGVHTGVAKLSGGVGELGAGVVGGDAAGRARGRGREGEVAALDGAADGRGGGAQEDEVAGRVDDEAEAFVEVESDQEGDGVVAEDVDVG